MVMPHVGDACQIITKTMRTTFRSLAGLIRSHETARGVDTLCEIQCGGILWGPSWGGKPKSGVGSSELPHIQTQFVLVGLGWWCFRLVFWKHRKRSFRIEAQDPILETQEPKLHSSDHLAPNPNMTSNSNTTYWEINRQQNTFERQDLKICSITKSRTCLSQSSQLSPLVSAC